MSKKLIFNPELYIGEGMKEIKTDKIKKILMKRPSSAGVYVLALANNPSDQLVFFDAKQLDQHYYDVNPVHIVGIAKDYSDALQLIERITKECLDTRGDCCLKEYLLC